MWKRLILVAAFAFLAGCPSSIERQAIAPPDDAWFKENVVAQPGLVIVDFTATWCGPCKMLKPFLEKLEADYAGKVKVVPIDVDAREDLKNHYQVSSFPTLLMMRDGKVIDFVEGAFRDYEGLKAWAEPQLK